MRLMFQVDLGALFQNPLLAAVCYNAVKVFQTPYFVSNRFLNTAGVKFHLLSITTGIALKNRIE